MKYKPQLFLMLGFTLFLISCNSKKVNDRNYKLIVSELDSSIVLEKFNLGLNNRISRVYYEGKLLEEILYDKKGTILSYQFFSLKGGWCYWSHYDSNGKFLRAEGEPSYHGVFYVKHNKNQDYYTSKDTLVVLFFAPRPPNCLTEFRNQKNKAFYNLDNFSCAHFGIYYPFEPGNYEFEFTLNFFDSNSLKYTKKDINQIITISR